MLQRIERIVHGFDNKKEYYEAITNPNEEVELDVFTAKENIFFIV